MDECIYSIIIFMFLSFQPTNSNLSCSDEIVCPSDKPYCTDAGCVYECPRPLYTNGSTCVSSCGEWFLSESSCTSACPSSWYYRETPIVIGLKVSIEKMCTPYCVDGEYSIGNSCVHACPSEFGFIDGQQCVKKCPQNKHYQFNFTIKSVSYYKCLDKCPELTDDVFCTGECGADLYELNQTCVHTCPDSHPLKSGKNCAQTCSDEFIYYDNNNTCQINCSTERPFFYPTNKTCGNMCHQDMYITTRRGVVYCEEQCQQHEVVYNGSCLSSCFEPYVWDTKLSLINGTCIDMCPDGMLKNQNDQGQSFCTYICAKDKVLFNMSCVDLCPHNFFIINSTCVEKCPPEKPYVCQAHIGQRCGEICPPFTNGNVHDICVDKCPYYRDGNTCVQICPASTYTYDNVCATKCPSSKMFIQVAEISFQKCSISECVFYFCDTFTKTYETELKNTCVSSCQDELVLFNFTCQSSCPDEYPYLVNGTCQNNKCSKFMYKLPNYITCTDKCKSDEFIYDSTCVNQCPDDTFITNRKCHVDMCTTKYSYKRGNITFCTDDCTGFGFVLDTICVEN